MRIIFAALSLCLVVLFVNPARAERHPVESSRGFVDIAAVPAYPIESAQHSAHHVMHRQARHHRYARAHHAKPEISTRALKDGGADNRIEGTMRIADAEFEFVSGGKGAPIPPGDYAISPDSQGSWGARHGALDLTGSDRGVIRDPQLGRDREGIELHGGSFATLGCVAIKQWAKAKRKILSMIKAGGAFLHVSPGAVSITPIRSSGPVIVELHQTIKQDREVRAERRTKRYVRHRRYRHYARG